MIRPGRERRPHFCPPSTRGPSAERRLDRAAAHTMAADPPAKTVVRVVLRTSPDRRDELELAVEESPECPIPRMAPDRGQYDTTRANDRGDAFEQRIGRSHV